MKLKKKKISQLLNYKKYLEASFLCIPLIGLWGLEISQVLPEEQKPLAFGLGICLCLSQIGKLYIQYTKNNISLTQIRTLTSFRYITYLANFIYFPNLIYSQGLLTIKEKISKLIEYFNPKIPDLNDRILVDIKSITETDTFIKSNITEIEFDQIKQLYINSSDKNEFALQLKIEILNKKLISLSDKLEASSTTFNGNLHDIFNKLGNLSILSTTSFVQFLFITGLTTLIMYTFYALLRTNQRIETLAIVENERSKLFHIFNKLKTDYASQNIVQLELESKIQEYITLTNSRFSDNTNVWKSLEIKLNEISKLVTTHQEKLDVLGLELSELGFLKDIDLNRVLGNIKELYKICDSTEGVISSLTLTVLELGRNQQTAASDNLTSRDED